MRKLSNLIFEIPESFINKYYENSLLYIKLFNEYGFDFGINSFIADSEDYQYLKELNAYIGVFGQQCRSSTGHFCNEIF